MASFEDYDEFGNYIGADLESDEEEDIPQTFGRSEPVHVQPLEGYDEEPERVADEVTMMEIDGAPSVFLHTSGRGCNSQLRAISQCRGTARRQTVLSISCGCLWSRR